MVDMVIQQLPLSMENFLFGADKLLMIEVIDLENFVPTIHFCMIFLPIHGSKERLTEIKLHQEEIMQHVGLKTE